jgi:hypothetical protein
VGTGELKQRAGTFFIISCEHNKVASLNIIHNVLVTVGMGYVLSSAVLWQAYSEEMLCWLEG